MARGRWHGDLAGLAKLFHTDDPGRLFVPDPLHPTILDAFMEPKVQGEVYQTVRQALERAPALMSEGAQRVFSQVAESLGGNYALSNLAEALLPNIRELQVIKGGRAGWTHTRTPEAALGQPSFDDPMQCGWDNCWLIAAMVALAWTNPAFWAHRLNAAPLLNSGRHKWTILRHGDPSTTVQVVPEFPWDGGKPVHCQSRSGLEYWPALVEKAVVMYLNLAAQPPIDAAGDALPDKAQYGRSLNRRKPRGNGQPSALGQPETALEWLTGRQGIKSTPDDGDELRGALVSDSGQRKPLVVSTHDTHLGTLKGKKLKDAGLARNHAYAVLDVVKEANVEWLVLRDPTGMPTPNATPPPAAWRNAQEAAHGVPFDVDHGYLSVKTDELDTLFDWYHTLDEFLP
jgi:hypothetical protein